ncbi:MAG: hypothetical protein DRJ59_05915 [Thermoprotei archaeon]|nr:MAG: hypothetical protein DRJ59_05915 [Thermoprotei archaeon]
MRLLCLAYAKTQVKQEGKEKEERLVRSFVGAITGFIVLSTRTTIILLRYIQFAPELIKKKMPTS